MALRPPRARSPASPAQLSRAGAGAPGQTRRSPAAGRPQIAFTAQLCCQLAQACAGRAGREQDAGLEGCQGRTRLEKKAARRVRIVYRSHLHVQKNPLSAKRDGEDDGLAGGSAGRPAAKSSRSWANRACPRSTCCFGSTFASAPNWWTRQRPRWVARRRRGRAARCSFAPASSARRDSAALRGAPACKGRNQRAIVHWMRRLGAAHHRCRWRTARPTCPRRAGTGQLCLAPRARLAVRARASGAAPASAARRGPGCAGAAGMARQRQRRDTEGLRGPGGRQRRQRRRGPEPAGRVQAGAEEWVLLLWTALCMGIARARAAAIAGCASGRSQLTCPLTPAPSSKGRRGGDFPGRGGRRARGVPAGVL